jgi:hypothetical protein
MRMSKILLHRGNFLDLPSSAELGELLVTLDTHHLYLGQGSGNALVDLSIQGPQGTQGLTGSNGTQGLQGSAGPQGSPGAQGTQGFQGTSGGGGGLVRYAAASSPNCQIFATGTGVDVVITGSNPCTATITVPGGVQIISASIYITAAQLGSTSTGFSVVLPSGFGVGAGTTYFATQFQLYRDTGGARAAMGAVNYNTAQNTMSITSLVTNMAYIMNIAF